MTKEAKKLPNQRRAATKIDTSAAPLTELQKLDAVGIDEVCSLIESGNSMRDIAKQAGVSQRAMWMWVGEDSRTARVRIARTKAAFSYDEAAMSELKGAKDQFELSKAREIASHLRWRASKFNVSDFGDRQTVDLNAKITLSQAEVDDKLAALQTKLLGRAT